MQVELVNLSVRMFLSPAFTSSELNAKIADKTIKQNIIFFIINFLNYLINSC
jgi:hypothetical protein